MTIYLSASAIKDFLSCSKRYEFRRFAKSKAEETEAMSIGTAVHNTLENCWDCGDFWHYAEELSFEFGFTDKAEQKFFGLLSNYLDIKGSFALSNRDTIEKVFTVPYREGVHITGKFDRILEESVILDWKTGKLPISITHDPQFIIYDWAFEKIYGYKPSTVMAVSLSQKKLAKYKRNDTAVYNLMYEIVPHILDRIENREYFYEGRYSFYSTCKNCSFLRYCDNELASRNPIERKVQN